MVCGVVIKKAKELSMAFREMVLYAFMSSGGFKKDLQIILE